MKPYYEDALVTLYHGDCREVLPEMGAGGVVVADPPYGIGWKGGTLLQRRQELRPISGDTEDYDPAAVLALGLPSIIWGANHFASRLPGSAGWLVWDKRPSGFSNDQADCEIAWSNLSGPARMFRKAWNGGGSLARENGAAERHMHPNQKPVALMEWCIGMMPDGLVIDPYTGSGTTLLAARSLGRRCVGIEIEERYCEIAAKRLAQGSLFEVMS